MPVGIAVQKHQVCITMLQLQHHFDHVYICFAYVSMSECSKHKQSIKMTWEFMCSECEAHTLILF